MSKQSVSLLRKSFPVFLAVSLIILANLHVQIADRSPFPHVLSMVVFFWALYLPSVMNKLVVFFLCIFYDFLYGSPLGVSAIGGLLIWWVIVMQRRFLIKEPFWVVWLSYSLFVTVFMAINVALFSILSVQWMLDDRVILLTLLSVGYYPFLHSIFMSFYRDFLKGMVDDTYI